jgi:branched-chain amino acid transport system substrate-binding protein
MEQTVYYNRGILQAAVWVAAIKNALTLTHGQKPTGADIKKGFEMIKDFALGGIVPPLTITPEDHEGGGWVQIFAVKGNGFEKKTPWFRAYRQLVVDTAAKTAKQLAAK